ncbi:hypothetical protein D3C80_1625340 [compost metagenome]
MLVTQADQGVDIGRKVVAGLGLEADVIAVLAPDPVEQAEQIVIEEIEECRAHAFALGMLVSELVQVVAGQR